VPLVQVVLAHLETEHLEQAGAADAKDDLLLETVDLVAAVQVVGF